MRHATQSLLHRAPLTAKESELVDLWAQNWCENQVVNQGLNPWKVEPNLMEPMVEARRIDLMRQIGQGDLIITRRHGLHIHGNPGPGLDPYYTCIRCYGD